MRARASCSPPARARRAICVGPPQPAGTVIGAPDTFRPTHYGDVLAWELPGTGIRDSVSHKLFRRPDPSRDAEQSLWSDVVLTPTWDDYLRGTDIFQQWIMEQL